MRWSADCDECNISTPKLYIKYNFHDCIWVFRLYIETLNKSICQSESEASTFEFVKSFHRLLLCFSGNCYRKVLIISTALSRGLKHMERVKILIVCEGFVKILIVWELFVIENDKNRSITRSKTHLTLTPTEIYSLNTFWIILKISK